MFYGLIEYLVVVSEEDEVVGVFLVDYVCYCYGCLGYDSDDFCVLLFYYR